MQSRRVKVSSHGAERAVGIKLAETIIEFPVATLHVSWRLIAIVAVSPAKDRKPQPS